jgi:hypothetical protein
MIDITNPAALRARFAELGETRTAALAVSTPLREERDGIAVDSAKKIADLDVQICEAELGLFELDQERALIARALGGRTGEG